MSGVSNLTIFCKTSLKPNAITVRLVGIGIVSDIGFLMTTLNNKGEAL